MKPNVCRSCGAYVGPESVAHRHGFEVGPWLTVVPDPSTGTVQHATIDGDGVVARLRKRSKRARRKA